MSQSYAKLAAVAIIYDFDDSMRAIIWSLKKKSLILQACVEQLNDRRCLPRAAVLGMAFADTGSMDGIKDLLRRNSKSLPKRIEKLIKKCNIKIDPLDGCYLNDVVKIANHYNDYQFVVYNSFTDHNNVLIKSAHREKKVNLFHVNEHFVAIRSVCGLFGYTYQCADCDKVYNTKTTHKCSAICNYCRKNGPCAAVLNMMYCAQCNRNFRGVTCYLTHTKNKICEIEIVNCVRNL